MAMKAKRRVGGRAMRANTYALLERCIEDGLSYGWNHAHKHVDAPDRDLIVDEMLRAVMNQVYEWFEFEPFGDG